MPRLVKLIKITVSAVLTITPIISPVSALRVLPNPIKIELIVCSIAENITFKEVALTSVTAKVLYSSVKVGNKIFTANGENI